LSTECKKNPDNIDDYVVVRDRDMTIRPMYNYFHFRDPKTD